MSTAAERLWKQLEVPASLMGGQTSILSLADVHHVLNENDRLRSAAEFALTELKEFLNDDKHSRMVRDRLRAALKQTK